VDVSADTMNPALLERVQATQPCCDNVLPRIVNATAWHAFGGGILMNIWDAILVRVCFHDVCSSIGLL
jgi:hypothetical protein